jgi:hypothetical protein
VTGQANVAWRGRARRPTGPHRDTARIGTASGGNPSPDGSLTPLAVRLLLKGQHAHRRARLRAAAAVAAAEPPLLVRGDLVDDLPALAAQAPAGATLVVFHNSVMYQVPAPRREAFAEVVRGLPGHWIANESPGVLPYDALPKPPAEALHNVLALDGTPLAWTRPHGQAIIRFA